MANTAYQPIGTNCKTKSSVSEANIFSADNIRNCENYVSEIQGKLDKALG